jgi:hypothetical protein
MNNCPYCNVSFIGDPIPEDMRYYVDSDGVKQTAYSGTHWRLEIGIDGGYMGIHDGIVAYRCFSCKQDFPRCDEPWALDMFKQYKDFINRGGDNGL